MLWLSYGDANTHFFHVQAKIKCARQHIANLKDESEEWLWGSNLHNHVINHIQCLFQSGMSTASLPPPQTLQLYRPLGAIKAQMINHEALPKEALKSP